MDITIIFIIVIISITFAFIGISITEHYHIKKCRKELENILKDNECLK